MRLAVKSRDTLSRLFPVLVSLIAYATCSRAYPAVTGDYESALGIMVGLLSLLSPGAGAALTGLPMVIWWVHNDVGIGLVITLLYAGLAVRGLRRWWVVSTLVLSVSLATLLQSMDMVAVALLLTAAALLSPGEAAIYTLTYALMISIPISITGAAGLFANKGMIVTPCQGAIPKPGTMHDLLAWSSVERASRILTLYYESLIGNGMTLLLEVIAFTAAGYGAAKLRQSHGETRLGVLLAGALPSLLIACVYAWSVQRLYGSGLPPDYYLPLVVMTPSFLATASSIARAAPQKPKVRVRRIGPLPTFKDVGGLHEIKRLLYETIIMPLKNRKLMEKYGVRLPRGILLFGPPGCGKTLLMKALAREAGIRFLYVKSSDILSKWYGESERKLAELFHMARAQAPSILFFDEIDALARSRESYSSDDVAPRLLSILLSEIDGLESSDGVIVVGSTNIPEVLDPALLRPGRFDHVIYVPPPDKEARREIFEIHTRNIPLADDVDFDALAEMTEGFSGADIEAVCQEVARSIARKALATGRKVEATMSDFLDAIRRFRPSITPEMLERYEEFSRRFGGITSHYPTSQGLIDLSEAKAAIMSTLQLVVSSKDGLSQPVHSVLLFGPPGCGKSSLIEEAASAAGLSLVTLDLRNAERQEVDEAFKRAQRQSPSVLLLEEFNSREWGVATALAVVEAARRSRRRILVVLTTSTPDSIPKEAVLRGLFDRAIYVPPPDGEARKAALLTETSKHGLELAFNPEEAAELTAGYSMRGVILVTRRAAAFALEEGASHITLDHFLRALGTLPPDLSPDHFRSIERFISNYSGLVLGFKGA